MSYLQQPFLVLSVACPHEGHMLSTNLPLLPLPEKTKIG